MEGFLRGVGGFDFDWSVVRRGWPLAEERDPSKCEICELFEGVKRRKWRVGGSLGIWKRFTTALEGCVEKLAEGRVHARRGG